jgi:D-alanine-D-alanine ligase
MRLALVYNLRGGFPARPGDPPDAAADWDVVETIEKISGGLERAGHVIVDVGEPSGLLNGDIAVDLVFGICEMTGLRHREAQVPALCELLGLPYAFSPPDVMVTTLDKNLANLLVAQAGAPVPEWVLAADAGGLRGIAIGTEQPWIVKPVAEGSGMGISASAVARSVEELHERVRYITGAYAQPALIQRYCPGREITVGVVEVDGRAEPLAAMEVRARTDGSVLPVYGNAEKERSEELVTWSPLLPDDAVAEEARTLAVRCHEALGCRDASRIDLRADAAGDLQFLECNPLPHLHPVIGDFCRSAQAAGWTYEQLLGAIVRSAAERRRDSAIGRRPAAS